MRLLALLVFICYLFTHHEITIIMLEKGSRLRAWNVLMKR